MDNQNFITVRVEEKGLRLDKFISQNFLDISYSTIQKKIRLGMFRVNNLKKKPNYKVNYSDKIHYNKKLNLKIEKKTQAIIPEKIKILLKKSVIYEDKYILILNKPYGISVQGGSKISLSIDDLLPFLSTTDTKLRLTHRIDKNTTGVLVLAKSKEMAKKITFLFKENKIIKTYLTVVIGSPKKSKGCINAPLSKESIRGMERMKVKADSDKEAITYYKKIDYKKGLSLLEVSPKTGRTHQIRAHLLYDKHPVLGDDKYNLYDTNQNKLFPSLERKMHLHAKNITFKLNDKTYSFNAELPNHFVRTLKFLNFKIS